MILTILAHPDDETTIGPVLTKYIEDHSVYLAFSTDGSYGVNDHGNFYEQEALISSIRCHKSQYSPEEMESWIAMALADESNVLYFRKFNRDTRKNTEF